MLLQIITEVAQESWLIILAVSTFCYFARRDHKKQTPQ